jgi:hypothetical protein
MALQERTKELLLGAMGDIESTDDLINHIDEQGSGDIKSDGSVEFAADQSMGGNKLTDLATPTSDFDAATKKYVDDNSGGGGSPGGMNTQIQYNSSGSFAGSSSLTWDQTNKILTSDLIALDPTYSSRFWGSGAHNIVLNDNGTGSDALVIATKDQDSVSSAPIAIVTGSIDSGAQNPGTLNLFAGSTDGSGIGGLAILQGGEANTGNGGSVQINAGGTLTGSFGGVIFVNGGNAYSGTGTGGGIQITGGSSNGAAGGDITLLGGTGATTQGKIILEGLFIEVESPFSMSQISTPSNPTSGYNKLYFKSDGKLYRLNSSGVETLIG